MPREESRLDLGGVLQWVLQEGDIRELEFLQDESVHLCRLIGGSMET